MNQPNPAQQPSDAFDKWWNSFTISTDEPDTMNDRTFAKAAWDAALSQPIEPQGKKKVKAPAALQRLADYFRRISDLWEGPDGCADRGTVLCDEIRDRLEILAREPMALGLTSIPPFPVIEPQGAVVGDDEDLSDDACLIDELRLQARAPFNSDCCNAGFPIAANIRLLEAAADRLSQLTAALSQPIEPQGAVVDEAMVTRYCDAVAEYLGSLSPKDWEIERFDPVASTRKVARIGLEAARLANPAVIDDSVVERACRAICAKHGHDPDERTRYSGSNKLVRTKDGEFYPQWKMHEPEVRTALEAALPVAVGAGEAVSVPRYATHEMCEAAHFGPNCAEENLRPSDREFWEACWTAMVDAAMTPATPAGKGTDHG